MEKRVRVVIGGRVQGVNFRDSVKRWADLKQVRGWIKNRRDGELEAVFEGESESVEYLVSFCRCGPPLSRISAITVEEEPYNGEFESFKVVFD